MKLNTAQEIIDDIRLGKMVILMDDECRENEGDLIMAAEKVSAEDINFMARFARGLICLTLTPERCERLNLSQMVEDHLGKTNTAFTVSIEAAEGVTTGISAADRAATIQAAVAKNAVASDIVQPGHVFPVMARPAGLLNRAGHTEAGCDLAGLAGFEPSSVIVEIMNDDGSMARRPDLEEFALKHNLKIGTVEDLIHYRLATEITINRISEREVNTRYGGMRLLSYRDTVYGYLHIAFVKGEIRPDELTITRVCNMEPLRDIFGINSVGFNSWSIGDVLSHIENEEKGVLLLVENGQKNDSLLSQEELLKEREAAPFRHVLSDSAAHAVVGMGCQILRDIGVGKMRLMSKEIRYAGLAAYGLEIVEFLEPPQPV